MNTSNAQPIGKAAAILSAMLAIIYSVFQLLAVFQLIPHPKELFWLFLPSLLLAYTFLITIICLHFSVRDECKIYTAIATALALLYCGFVSIVYFTQLTVVIPLLTQNKIDENHVLAFTSKSFLVALDCMGYTTMNAATLFAAFAFRHGEHKWLYRSFLLNGFQTPIVILAFFIPAFMFVGALWMITLPMAMINASRLLGRKFYQPFIQTRYETAMAQ